jgi:hypothetical protein
VTRTEERLTDALGAAARAIRGDILPPLQFSERERRRPAWVAPVAAAASLLLVVGLAVAVSRQLLGSRATGSPGAPIAPHRYYVEAGLNAARPVVRSTATGAVTATVPVPRMSGIGEYDLVSSVGTGTFFVIAFVPGVIGQRLYRFRVTGSGRVSGFAAVPGGPLGGRQWEADAIAASPDGSRVAISFRYLPQVQCPAGSQVCTSTGQDTLPDFVVVVDPATGVRDMWSSGVIARSSFLSIASLSWTGNGRELVFLGQRCEARALNSEICLPPQKGQGSRAAEVWGLDLSEAGRLDSARVLLRQSARFPYIAQALISPDGSTITALVLTGPVAALARSDGAIPAMKLSVVQISAATGKLVRVLYRRDLNRTTEIDSAPNFLLLTPDGAGQQWMLSGGLCNDSCAGTFHGWIDGGRLVPIQPSHRGLADEAW